MGEIAHDLVPADFWRCTVFSPRFLARFLGQLVRSSDCFEEFLCDFAADFRTILSLC